MEKFLSKTTMRRLALASTITLAMGGVGYTLAADQQPNPLTCDHVADARREAQIQTGLDMNSHLRSFDLSVTVDGSDAVLKGSVDDSVSRDLAAQIAMSADGISRVENRIVIDPNAAVKDNVTAKGNASDGRDFSQKVDDATITASIKSKLLWNSRTDGFDIHVDTSNGKVLLTGSETSDATKSLAGQIALDTDGVASMKNEIVVTNKPDEAMKIGHAGRHVEQDVSDSWITAKVKSSLMLTHSLEFFAITVTTTHGVVTLVGTVDTAAERNLAVQVAQDIQGVAKVDASGIKTS